MPTYQYACTACGHRLEAVQSFSDNPLTECPVCEGQLRKLFSAVGIVFKGSGFYRTDSRAGANGNGHRSGSTREPATTSSSPNGNGSSTTSTANGSAKTGTSGSGSTSSTTGSPAAAKATTNAPANAAA